MAATVPFPHSKGEINRCGDYLLAVRRHLASPHPTSEVLFDMDRIDQAWAVVSDYRSAHS